MNSRFLALLGVAALITVLLLVNASRSGTSTVYQPSEILAEELQDLQRVRVAGKVVAKEIQYQVEPNFLLSFSVKDPGLAEDPEEVLDVRYQGIKPDMFAPGRDVIIDGDLKAGVLHASKLLTQCPSKYEPPTPEGKESTAKKDKAY